MGSDVGAGTIRSHLRRRTRGPPPRRCSARRSPRRMAGQRPPLPLRSLHGPTTRTTPSGG